MNPWDLVPWEDKFTGESRRVGLYEKDGLFVSTVKVSDGQKPYETAVEHAEYNGGEMVIVEAYDTFEQSVEGHQKWVNIMTTEPLPMQLADCHNSAIGRLILEKYGPMIHPRTIDGFFVAEEPKQLPKGGDNELSE